MVNANCLINVRLDPGLGMDKETLQQQTIVVLNNICQLEGVQARLVRGDKAESGYRGDPVTVGAIAISMIGGGVVAALIQFLRDWALRGENRKVTVKATVNGNTIEVEYFPSGTKETELIAFAERLTRLVEKEKKGRASKN